MRVIKELLYKYREKITFLVAGIMTTLCAWTSYAIFIHMGYGINISNIVSWIIAVIFAYIVNKIFVFQKYGWGVTQLLKEIIAFVSSRLVTGAIEIISVPLLIEIGITQSFLSIDGFWAKFIAGLLPLVLNYILGKRAVFKVKETNR